MSRSSRSANENAAIAQRLTKALDACQPPLSRIELAKRLRVTPGAVSHYLNGNRPCPNDVVEKIAKITKIEPGWLLHGPSSTRSDSNSSAATSRRGRSKKLSWVFREAPADGGKDFGNAAVYAT